MVDHMAHITHPEFRRASTQELLNGLRQEEQIQRQSAAMQGAMLAELERRGIRDCTGYPDAISLLRGALHLTLSDARARVARAHALNPLGDRKPGMFPAATAAAASEGAIGAGQINEILGSLARLPDTLTDHDRELDEKKLADLARTAGPGVIRQAAKDMLAEHALNGHKLANPCPEQPRRKRDEEPVEERVHFRWRRGGGHYISATVTDETCASFKVLLDKHDHPRPEADGVDRRTLSRRRGDAFTVLLTRSDGQDVRPRDERPGKAAHPISSKYLRQGKRKGPQHLSRAERRRLRKSAKAQPDGG